MITNKIFYCMLIISTITLSCISEDIDPKGIELENLENSDDPAQEQEDTALKDVEQEPQEPLTEDTDNIIQDNVTSSEVQVNVGNETVETPVESVNVTQKQVNCLLGQGTSHVQIVNDTELIKLLLPNTNITTKDTPASCLCVLFFSKHCPFSSLAAPHYNALPRAFPDLKMVAINAIMYHLFNTQNGIVGVPSLLLLHNGKIIDKFNESDYTLEHFSRFITKNTGIAAAEKSFVTSADFAGPVASTPNKETDILLITSWCFIIFCVVYYFTRSKWWRWIVESVKHNWRESEAQAQHEHVD